MIMRKTVLFLVALSFSAVCFPVRSEPFPLLKFQFRVTIDSKQFEFQEITGLASDLEGVKTKGGNSVVYSTIKMPGIKRYGNVTMKKGIAPNTKIIADYLNQKSGSPAKKTNITIDLLDENGKVSMTWILINAFPVKITTTDVKAKGNEIAIESIEVVHEGITQKK